MAENIKENIAAENAGAEAALDRLNRLLATARDGNELAFEEMMRLFRGDIYRIAQTLLGGADEAMEVSQDVFLRLFRSLGRLNNAKGLRAWLRRVTVNRCYDILKGRMKQDDIEKHLLPGCMQVSDSLDSSQISHFLKQALDILAPRERTALMLVCQLGFSSDEAAKAMGCRPPTVRSLTFKAREKLRALFRPQTNGWNV